MFEINNNPEVDYYKASLLIRNIVQELFDPETVIQKLDIVNSKYQTYQSYQDKYDDYLNDMIDVSF